MMSDSYVQLLVGPLKPEWKTADTVGLFPMPTIIVIPPWRVEVRRHGGRTSFFVWDLSTREVAFSTEAYVPWWERRSVLSLLRGVEMFLKKRTESGQNGYASNEPNDPEFLVEYAGLWEHLTCHMYEGGGPRVTSTLLVFVEDGLFKLCLNDRDNGQVAFLSAETFSEALKDVDQKIIEGRLEWRMSRVSSRPKK
jgi:hypothetical protein